VLAVTAERKEKKEKKMRKNNERGLRDSNAGVRYGRDGHSP
jgi:hypothetical protein